MANRKASDPAPQSAEELAGKIVAMTDEEVAVELHAHGTVRSTKTIVEDRTENPEVRPVVEYEKEEMEVAHGTILTTYGEPVGGFPEASGDAE